MSIWFWVSVLGEIVIFPIYILSLEHIKLEKKFSQAKAVKIGNLLGLISGWGFFLFLFGIWLSPQPRFTIPLFPDLVYAFPIINFKVPLSHLIIFCPIILVVLWIALLGVKEVSLKVAETHRADKIVIAGIYSHLRHPQYLGAILAHISISIFLSAWYSILLTPFLILYIYILAWKEEKELLKEFGSEYEDYMKKIPMFIPKLRA